MPLCVPARRCAKQENVLKINKLHLIRPHKQFLGRGPEALSKLIILIPLLSSALFANTWYVATNGNDNNAGTAAAPFATIQQGVNVAQPGDTVLVGDGTYGPNGHYTCGTVCSQNGYAAPVVFQNSGTSSAPITVAAQDKGKAILNCNLPTGYSGDGTDGVQACDTYFDFQGSASYINIENFDITATYWNGANVNGSNNHDIQFIGNHFYNIGNRHYVVPAGGVSNGITGVYAGTSTSDITFNGNTFNNIGRLPTSGQSETDYNHDHGIYLYNGPYTITNNIFYNQQAGWDIQISPGVHNTSILCNTFVGPNPQRDGLIELWADSSNPNTGIDIQDNIFYNGRNYAIDSYDAVEEGALIDHNLVYGSPSGVINASVVAGSMTVSNNMTNTNPNFVNPTANDYQLQAGSPAIDAGVSVLDSTDIDGNLRPESGAWDDGAYEYVSGAAAASNFSISAANSGLTVARSKSTSDQISTAVVSGGPDTIQFSISGVPASVKATWSTTSCSAPCSSVLTLSASSSARTGTSNATITASSGGVTKNLPLQIRVMR